jgi:hypothetical protein
VINAPFSECIAFVRQVGKCNVVVSKEGLKRTDMPVTLDLAGGTLEDALFWMTWSAGCQYRLVDQAVVIEPVARHPIPIKPGLGAEARERLAKKVSVEFQTTPAKECLDALAVMANHTVIVDPRCGKALKKAPRMTMRKTAIHRVLEEVVRQAGLELASVRGAVLIYPRPTKRVKPAAPRSAG